MWKLPNQKLLRDGVIAKHLKHCCDANEDAGEAAEGRNPRPETKQSMQQSQEIISTNDISFEVMTHTNRNKGFLVFLDVLQKLNTLCC